jgi:hypothetical protein
MQNWSYKFRLDNSGFLAYDEFSEIGRANFCGMSAGFLINVRLSIFKRRLFPL